MRWWLPGRPAVEFHAGSRLINDEWIIAGRQRARIPANIKYRIPPQRAIGFSRRLERGVHWWDEHALEARTNATVYHHRRFIEAAVILALCALLLRCAAP